MKKARKATIAKFSVLKGIYPKLKPMHVATLKCGGDCECRCCK